MKYLLISVTLVLSITYNNAVAQSKSDEKYRTQSEEMRKEVWAWDKPEFKVKEVPAKYANASKVILAHHTELTADSKSKFAFYGLAFSIKKDQTIIEVVRELVKLNDNAAIKDFSELSFTQFRKSSGFFTLDKTTTYLGVRIIKVNGSIKEINADDIILTKDEKNENNLK